MNNNTPFTPAFFMEQPQHRKNQSEEEVRTLLPALCDALGEYHISRVEITIDGCGDCGG